MAVAKLAEDQQLGDIGNPECMVLCAKVPDVNLTTFLLR